VLTLLSIGCRKDPVVEPNIDPLSMLTSQKQRDFFDRTFIVRNNAHVQGQLKVRTNEEYIDSVILDLLALELTDPFVEALIDLVGYPIWEGAEVEDNDSSSVDLFVTIPMTTTQGIYTTAVIYAAYDNGEWHYWVLTRENLHIALVTAAYETNPNFVGYLVALIASDQVLFAYNDSALISSYIDHSEGLQSDNDVLTTRCGTVILSNCTTFWIDDNRAIQDTASPELELRQWETECVTTSEMIGCTTTVFQPISFPLEGGFGGTGGTGGGIILPDTCGQTIGGGYLLCDYHWYLYSRQYVQSYNYLIQLLNAEKATWLRNYTQNAYVLDGFKWLIENYSSNTLKNLLLFDLWIAYRMDDTNNSMEYEELLDLMYPYTDGLNQIEGSWLRQNLSILNHSEAEDILTLLGTVHLSSLQQIDWFLEAQSLLSESAPDVLNQLAEYYIGKGVNNIDEVSSVTIAEVDFLQEYIKDTRNSDGSDDEYLYDFGKSAVDALSLNPEFRVERITELDEKLAANPNFLLTNCIDSGEHPIEFWSDLVNFVPSQSIVDIVENAEGDFDIQLLDNARGANINLDYFSVNVSSLPDFQGSNSPETIKQLFDHVRKQINNFVDPNFAQFTPIASQDEVQWISSDPLGTMISIDIPGNDGAVIASHSEYCCWIFSTLKAPFEGETQFQDDGYHPVSGNRQFGFVQEADASWTIYVKGADRIQRSWISLVGDIGFAASDALWDSFSDKVESFVNSNSGSADEQSSEMQRPKWSNVREALKSSTPITVISCN
jgi:hypothetical protein